MMFVIGNYFSRMSPAAYSCQGGAWYNSLVRGLNFLAKNFRKFFEEIGKGGDML